MVRVGGGWDTLDNYLLSHDPCRVALFRKAGGPADLLNVKSADGAVVERGYKSTDEGNEKRSVLNPVILSLSPDSFHV